jgi:hypothetical protein
MPAAVSCWQNSRRSEHAGCYILLAEKPAICRAGCCILLAEKPAIYRIGYCILLAEKPAICRAGCCILLAEKPAIGACLLLYLYPVGRNAGNLNMPAAVACWLKSRRSERADTP